jgi:hypothetical protein
LASSVVSFLVHEDPTNLYRLMEQLI